MSKKTRSRPKPSHQEEDLPPPKTEKKESQQEFTLYKLLEVDKKASSEEIKKQYRKLVLVCHPDKNQEDPMAREKFQKLKEAYEILMDQEKRKQYDQTGEVGKDFNESNFQSAYEYFRKMFKKVTKEDIDQFTKEYREGPMEKEDLLDYYDQHEGDMVQLLQCIPLSTNQDIPRFLDFFEEQIDLQNIPFYIEFDETKNKIRKLKNEEKEFEEEQKKGMQALVAAIKGKNEQKMDFLASLEQKYGAGAKKKVEKEGVKNKKTAKKGK